MMRCCKPLAAGSLVALGFTALVGCHRPTGAFAPAARLEPGVMLVVPLEGATSVDAALEAAASVLRRHRFRIDRFDRSAGVITTYPETSQQFFEFWRRDVATARDWLDASVNPVRRRVEVRLPAGRARGTADEGGADLAAEPPAEPPGLLDEAVTGNLQVLVYKERLSAPDRQFNDAGSAYQFFGYSLPATTGQAVITTMDEHWLDQGRDSAFEAYLLGEMAHVLGGRVEPGAPAGR